MSNKGKTVALFTILHFFVDFSTIFLISGVAIEKNISIADRSSIIILYNLLAFAGQLPIGILADLLQKNYIIAATGCAAVAISYPLAEFSPWISCIVAALGNGAFHIGGGSEVLRISMPKANYPGVFVSSGAFGVWAAYKFSEEVIAYVVPIIMLVSFFLLVFVKKGTLYDEKTTISFEKPRTEVMISTSCFLLTIVIRSLLGMVMNFSWKTVPLWSVLFAAMVVAGKALGGFLGDRIGNIKTTVISLGISLVGFIFSFEFPIAGIVSVLCFNMTMPLTLTAIASVSKNKYGFSFGMTTFALAAGFIPIIFGAEKLFSVTLLVTGVFISLLLMLVGFKLIKK